MLRTACQTLFASALVASLCTQGASASLLFDDFTGDALDTSTWTETGTTGFVEVGGGNLLLDVNFHGASNRRIVVSEASNFDPFTSPLQIQLNNVAVSPAEAAGTSTSGYVAIGLSYTGGAEPTFDAVDRYFPSASGLYTGLGAFIRRRADDVYFLMVREYVNGSQFESMYELNGAPTDLLLDIDGAGKTVTFHLTGTTFASDNEAMRLRALNEAFTAQNMTVDDEFISRIALGAFNQGPVGTEAAHGSKFTVGSINVVPEPASLGLVGAGLMLLATRRRR